MMMMMTDADVDPLKDATQDIDSVLVDGDGEEEEKEQNEENSIWDLFQHSSQELSQEQNPWQTIILHHQIDQTKDEMQRTTP